MRGVPGTQECRAHWMWMGGRFHRVATARIQVKTRYPKNKADSTLGISSESKAES